RHPFSSPPTIPPSHFYFAESHETSTSSARMVPPVCPSRIVIQRRPAQHLSPKLSTPSSQLNTSAHRSSPRLKVESTTAEQLGGHHNVGRHGQKSMIKLVYCI